MTIRLSKLNPLSIPAGKIRKDLEGYTSDAALAVLKSVEGIPDTRVVVVDTIAYNRTLMESNPDEGIQGQPGSDLGVEPESGGSTED